MTKLIHNVRLDDEVYHSLCALYKHMKKYVKTRLTLNDCLKVVLHGVKYYD